MCFWLLTSMCFGFAPYPPQQPYPIIPFPNYPGYPAIISGGPAPPIFFPTIAPAPPPANTTVAPPANMTTAAPSNVTSTPAPATTTPAPATTTPQPATTTPPPAPTTPPPAPTTPPPATTTPAPATTTTATTARTTLPTLTPVPSSPPPTTGITPPANVTPTQQPIPSVPPIDPRTVTSTTPQTRFGDEPVFETDTIPVRFGDEEEAVVIDLGGDSNTVNFPRDRRQSLPCGCYLPTQCRTDTNGIGLIDFRIVTGIYQQTTPMFQGTGTCSNGMQYCCPSATTVPQIQCGTRITTSANYPTQPGQARYGEYPWMAVIMSSDNLYIGGGVLIDTQNILTTAHRIVRFPNGAGLKIRLGEWDAAGNYEQYPYRDFTIARIWTHESFNPSTLQNDLAIIRILGSAAVGSTTGVMPICLPAIGQSFEGQRCWVSGWGKDSFGINGRYQNIIKTVDVPIISAMACETTLRTTRLGQSFILDRKSFVCAGGEVNKDACTGDGGSGLVCETIPGRWTLAGLVAWGLGCATQGIPGAYVNVPNYISWIQERQAIATYAYIVYLAILISFVDCRSCRIRRPPYGYPIPYGYGAYAPVPYYPVVVLPNGTLLFPTFQQIVTPSTNAPTSNTTSSTTTSTTTTARPNASVPLIDPRIQLETLDEEVVFRNDDTYEEPVETFEENDLIREKRQVFPTSPIPSALPTTCGCYSQVLCPPINSDGIGLIDFRIVIGGVPTCPTGLLYCCPGSVSMPSFTCGTRFAPAVTYPLQPGQARYGDYPWMVAILTTENQYIGGGVLIDTQNVLTTAHRIAQYPNGNGLKVRLGEWDKSANYEQYPYKDYSIAKLWLHELFNPSTLQNDIALIRLSGQVPTTQPIGVVPICMPSMGQQFEGQRCWVSGWGSDIFGTNGRYQNILKAVDLPIMSSYACENVLKTSRLGTGYVLDSNSFICAGGEVNKDACTGDGGSGLVCETSPDRWTLAGLVSWGLGCATPGIPGAYVNVVNFLPWIQARQTLP